MTRVWELLLQAYFEKPPTWWVGIAMQFAGAIVAAVIALDAGGYPALVLALVLSMALMWVTLAVQDSTALASMRIVLLAATVLLGPAGVLAGFYGVAVESAFMVILWAGVAAVFAAGVEQQHLWVKRRLARLPQHPRCTCGYDLTGNVSGICPECGTAIGSQGETGT